MAIDINPGIPLRHVATFNGSTNWTAPAGTNIAFVSMHGSSGGGGSGGSTIDPGRYGAPRVGGAGGASKLSAAFVQVSPGAVHSITVGAGGSGGAGVGQILNSAGATGGTTTFDSAFSQPGGVGGQGAQMDRYGGNNGAAGADAGNGFGTTSLTTLSPSSGAIPRVLAITTQATGGSAGGGGGAGKNNRYTGNNLPGAAGNSGQIHIYI
jgi:hypothetical protein